MQDLMNAWKKWSYWNGIHCHPQNIYYIAKFEFLKKLKFDTAQKCFPYTSVHYLFYWYPCIELCHVQVMGDSPDKMTYTEQANKRQHCKRLTSFIRLCDYLITNTMHSLGKFIPIYYSIKNIFHLRLCLERGLSFSIEILHCWIILFFIFC